MNLVNIQLSFESYLIVVHIMVVHAYLDISTFFFNTNFNKISL